MTDHSKELPLSQQQLLLRSNALQGAALETAANAVVITDTKGDIIWVNPAFTAFTGYSSEEVIGKNPRLLKSGKHDQYYYKNLWETVMAGKTWRGSFINRRKDGTLCYDEHTITPVRVGGGAITHFVAIMNDMTERRHAEEALQESEAKFRTLFDAANDAILILHNGVFVDCNASALELFGVTRDEIIAQTPAYFSPLTQPDGRSSEEKAKDVIQRAMTGEPQRFEWRHQHPDGTPVYTEICLNRFELNGQVYIQALARDMTERRRAEEAMRESEIKFRTLFDAANDSIFLVHDGLFVDCNARGLGLLGVAREQIIGRVPSSFSPATQPDGRDSHEKAMDLAQRAMAGVPQFYEWVHQKPDGTLVHTDISLSRLELGGEIYLQGVARDITEWKQAEEQLLLKTAFIEAQINSSLDGILILDKQGRKVVQNQRMIDLWGIPREIADATDDRSQREWVMNRVKNPREYTEVIAYFEAHPDKVGHNEVELLDGRIFERYSAPVLGKDGEYYGRIRTFRDITERKQAEAQIVEQAALLDNAREGIVVRDFDGKFLYWNKGAERIYGWTSQEALGQSFVEMLHADPKKFEEARELTISRGEWHGEIQHLTKDRRGIISDVHCTLICDQEGRPKSILSISTDITEKKKLEAQAMRAQRMESIGTLAGGIAHDLNNILAPILMSIDILRGESDNEETTAILDTIKVSAKRGADIVRQVLSFARGMEGERIEVKLTHELKELENLISNTFPKDIRLQISIPNDIWTILGDPTQVHQILLNLCLNARDAMPDGGSLSINVENCALDAQYAAMNLQAKPGRYVRINVTDSGTGIAPELIDKIFEPFFTTKELHKGTGLGLSTVLAIVKSHEGVINVYSEPGKGTTFRVYLPAAEPSCDVRKAQTGRVGLARGKGETVLIVDDEASILTITTQSLQAFGYRVLTAKDGTDAMAVYAEHRHEIALVITDMMMPFMDGSATIHALMRINPAVKIIAVSGLNANLDASKMAGVKHFLTKPYTAGSLLKTVRAVLDEPR